MYLQNENCAATASTQSTCWQTAGAQKDVEHVKGNNTEPLFVLSNIHRTIHHALLTSSMTHNSLNTATISSSGSAPPQTSVLSEDPVKASAVTLRKHVHWVS